MEYNDQKSAPDACPGTDPTSKSVLSSRFVTSMTARRLQVDAVRRYGLAEWLITRTSFEYEGLVLARLAVDVPTDYVLFAETLAELRALLPPGLVRSEPALADPPEVIEVWSSIECWPG